MKFLAILLITTLTTTAQDPVRETLTKRFQIAPPGLPMVPAADREAVLSAVQDLLLKHLTFRPDGTVSAVSNAFSVRQNVEWKNLSIRYIGTNQLNEADRLNGISKSYHASLSSDGSRRWDPEKNAWTPWRPGHPSVFPTGITVQWVNGKIISRGNPYLTTFQPGPGPSILDQSGKPNPKGLPPGLTPR